MCKKMATKIAVINAEFIVRSWDIDGYPNYFFGDDNQLYRITSRGKVRRNPRSIETLHTRLYPQKPLL